MGKGDRSVVKGGGSEFRPGRWTGPSYEPTEEEIRTQCELIRLKWSLVEERKRRGASQERPYQFPRWRTPPWFQEHGWVQIDGREIELMGDEDKES